MSTDNAQPRVNFTRQQHEYLNKQFPEMVGSAVTTDTEMRIRQGQRSVLAFIATKLATPSPGE